MKTEHHILVTGASGFVGSALLRRIDQQPEYFPIAAVRAETQPTVTGVTAVAIGDLSPATNWTPALHNISAVIHAAARVHVMAEHDLDPLSVYRQINVGATLNLARQAAVSGVRRFIYISSIKVNGELTQAGQSFKADDLAAPADPYAVSKVEAEDGLKKIAAETGMHVVIIRPPLVYGPGVKANFLSMLRWLHRGIPLPLGAIHNSRSLVGLDNLVDLIVTCIDHPAAANQTFLVSDGEDLSTPDLLQRAAKALGRPSRLFPVPVLLLKRVAGLLGRKEFAQRLCGSLQVDISKTRDLLNWTPPIGVDEELRRTAAWYLARQKNHSVD